MKVKEQEDKSEIILRNLIIVLHWMPAIILAVVLSMVYWKINRLGM